MICAAFQLLSKRAVHLVGEGFQQIRECGAVAGRHENFDGHAGHQFEVFDDAPRFLLHFEPHDIVALPGFRIARHIGRHVDHACCDLRRRFLIEGRQSYSCRKGGFSGRHFQVSAITMRVSAFHRNRCPPWTVFRNLLPHARAGNVKWRCAAVFAAAGVAGALLGAEFAKALNGDKLLVLFGLVMVAVGLAMFRKRDGTGNSDVRLTTDTARELLPSLLGIGFAVGLLSGFFGIGGGFLIVPGLILATGMPMTSAIGTSLVAVSAFGAATGASYAASGMIDWPIAALFVLDGVGGRNPRGRLWPHTGSAKASAQPRLRNDRRCRRNLCAGARH